MDNEKNVAGSSAPDLQNYAITPDPIQVRLGVREDNGLVMNNICMPQEILEIILSHFGLQDILTASLVCRRWLHVVRNPMFWKKIFERTSPGRWQILNTRLLSHVEEWYVYYSVLKHETFDRNLVRNPCGDMNNSNSNALEGWEIISGTPSLWRIASYDIDIPVAHLDGETVSKSCFETSSTSCSKEQYVNLWAHGFTPPVMRASAPFMIEFFEFVCTPPDKPGIFEASVALLDRDMRRLSSNPDYDFFLRIRVTGGSRWIKVQHKFLVLSAMCRAVVDKLKYVRIYHGGMEVGNSPENFQGPKLTSSTVRIRFMEHTDVDPTTIK